MSQKDLSAFGNRFSAGRATAGSTFTTVNENVQVLGSLSVGSGMTITGNTSMSGINANSVNINSGKTLIDSNGNITSLGNLSLSGVATLGSIYTGGTTSIQSLNFNSGNFSVDSNGNLLTAGSLGVSGNSTFTNLTSTTLSAGNTSIGGTLGVSGASTLNSVNLNSINVNSGRLSIDSNGNFASLGSFSTSGNSTFSNLNATGAVSIGGNATMLGPVYANSGIDVNSGKLSVDSNGNVSALGSLYIGGVATFSGTINSSGAAYLNSVNVNAGKFTIDSNGNVATLGMLSVAGNATFSNINVTGTAAVAGNLNMAGNISANGSLSGSSLNVGSSKFTIDSNGNVVSLGSISVAGAATMSSTLDVAGASSFGNSVNVQSGKFVIDSTGNVGIGSTPVGAVMDIYNNNSRIRMRGTGTGIEWNNSGSSVLSSVIYDTDSKLKMYSSATSNPKLSLDTNNVILIHDPTSSTLTSARHTAITPVGILTVAGIYTINVSQSGVTASISGTDSAALITYLTNNKAYLYIDDTVYRSRVLFPTVASGNLSFIDVITGSAVNLTSSMTNIKVYVASAVVTNAGKFLSAALVTNGNPQVVVSDQYGQLGLSA